VLPSSFLFLPTSTSYHSTNVVYRFYLPVAKTIIERYVTPRCFNIELSIRLNSQIGTRDVEREVTVEWIEADLIAVCESLVKRGVKEHEVYQRCLAGTASTLARVHRVTALLAEVVSLAIHDDFLPFLWDNWLS